MRHLTSSLLICVTLGVPLVSAACGGTVTGVNGNGNDSGAHEGGGAPDAMGTVHKDAGGPLEAAAKDTGPEAAPIDTNYPANHPPMPTVITGGGPTLANPVFIPVTFPDDPSQSDIVAFTSGIGATTFWSTIVTQYGVGPATSGTPVILTEAQEPAGTGGTIDDMNDLQPWLQTQVAVGGAFDGTNGPNTVYAIYLPAGTTITLQGAQSCQSFGGYHNNFTTSDTGTNVTYAIIPRCGSFPTASTTLSGIDAITGPASHEYLEAATDPQPNANNPGYAQIDNNDIVWEFILGGGEIGDLCAQFPGVFYKPAGFAYTVQRSWSNSAALASHDPCQPEVTGEVYFNSVGVLPTANVMEIGPTNAVTIPLHTSKVVEIDLFSDGPTSGPWSVQALDSAVLQGGPSSLSFSWDKTTGQNGDKLHLTITADSNPQFGAEGFILESQLGVTTNLWIGTVVVP